MIRQMLALAKKVQSDRVVFAYEASGQGYGLSDLLDAHGIECYILVSVAFLAYQLFRRLGHNFERRDRLTAFSTGSFEGFTSLGATRAAASGFRVCLGGPDLQLGFGMIVQPSVGK